MADKIPVSFNEKDKAEVKELAQLMGIADVYGDFPKALKFGIKLALSAIKNPEKVYCDLEEPELTFYLQSVKNAELKARLLKKAENLQKEAQKV